VFNQGEKRIASPEMLPRAGPLPHSNVPQRFGLVGAEHGADQHGDKR
jgi:hypothetical protein